MTAAAGAAAAAAAAKRREELRREEEQETAPMSGDDGYEYKILRTAWTNFRNPARLQGALDYEAQSGWDLFEKLDDQRLRLRRPISCRDEDATRPFDPYRSWVGPSDNAAAAFIVVAIFMAIAIMLGIMAITLH